MFHRPFPGTASGVARLEKRLERLAFQGEQILRCSAAMIERIHDGDLELAVIVRAAPPEPGIRFFTSAEATLQVGQMLRPAGYSIVPHVHRPVSREVSYTQEVLFIRSGRLRVDFYDEEQRYLESRDLAPGDVILLARGGHGFHMLEDCEIVEVKQGPYVGENDKQRFEHATAANRNGGPSAI